MTLLFFSCQCWITLSDFDGAHKQNKCNSLTQLQHAKQSCVNQLFTGSVQKLCCVEVSAHLSCGWTLPVVLSLVCFPTVPTTTGGKTPPGREASVEALRCLGVQRGNGIERQRKKGLPHSSTFTPCCCCCCWLPLLSLHLPSPPHQDGPVSPWRGNQTCRQQRSTKG